MEFVTVEQTRKQNTKENWKRHTCSDASKTLGILNNCKHFLNLLIAIEVALNPEAVLLIWAQITKLYTPKPSDSMKKLKDPILKNIDKSLPVLNIVRIALIHQPKKLLFRTMTNAKKYYLRPITTYPFQSKLNLQMYHMMTYLKLGILLTELITKSISIFENQISSRVEWSKADKNS